MSYARLRSDSLDNDCSSGSPAHENLPAQSSDLNRYPKWTAQKYSTLGIVQLLLTALLCLLSIAVLVTLLRLSTMYQGGVESCAMDQVKLKYGVNLEYMSISHQYDELWADMEDPRSSVIVYPANLGDAPEAHGAISMFHQLHCLASLRNALQRQRDGEDIGTDYMDDAHWPHCLDYLRMTILCWADDTIERPLIRNGSIVEISGLEDVRQCNSRTPVYELRSKYGELPVSY